MIKVKAKQQKKDQKDKKLQQYKEKVNPKKRKYDQKESTDTPKEESKESKEDKQAKKAKFFAKKNKKPFDKKGDHKGSKDKKNEKPNYKAKKPHFQLIESMKTHWNKIRERSTSEEARQSLLKEMIKAIKTHILEITLRHDVSRIIQSVLQFGDALQKDLVLQELLARFYEIAKTPYGHFTVLKAIIYCNTPAQMKKIVSSLATHFVSLGTHVIGARTVESILQLYPTNLTKSLKAEFYGRVSCSLVFFDLLIY